MFKPTKQAAQKAAMTSDHKALETAAREAGKAARFAQRSESPDSEVLWADYEQKVEAFNAAITSDLGAENAGALTLVAN